MNIQDFLGKRFHNRAGYTITVRYQEEHDSYHVHVDCSRGKVIAWGWGVYSGFKEDHIVGECLSLFDMTVNNIRNKTARRYFLRLIRELPMHEFKIKDFLNSSGDRVNWDKVREYEKQYEI